MSPPAVPRRTMICALASVALVPAALAACTPDAPPASAPAPSSGPAPTTTATPTSSAAPTTTTAAADPGIAGLADVPVGGGTVIEGPDGPLVLVQPTAGTVAAFSAVCPHQGAVVGAPSGGVIVCPSHGSRFAADTGAVQQGPASRGLTAVPVSVAGDRIVLA